MTAVGFGNLTRVWKGRCWIWTIGFWPGVWEDNTSKGIASNGISVKRGGPLLLILDGAILELGLDWVTPFLKSRDADNLEAAKSYNK